MWYVSTLWSCYLSYSNFWSALLYDTTSSSSPFWNVEVDVFVFHVFFNCEYSQSTFIYFDFNSTSWQSSKQYKHYVLWFVYAPPQSAVQIKFCTCEHVSSCLLLNAVKKDKGIPFKINLTSQSLILRLGVYSYTFTESQIKCPQES